MNGEITSAFIKESASLKQQLISSSEYLLREKEGEFSFSLKSLPYLSDHGFQDMIVLPGSAYIEMAFVFYDIIYRKSPRIIRNMKFENMIMLSNEATRIKVKATDLSNGNIRCEFYEYGKGDTDLNNFEDSFTTIEFEDATITDVKKINSEELIQKFKDQAVLHINSEDFYMKLRSNGNQYGPSFQNISQAWFSEGEALGKLSFFRDQIDLGEHYIHPTMLDSFTHLIPFLNESKGRAFVLTYIEQITINNLELPDDLWCYAKVSPEEILDDGEFQGELKIFDSKGELYLELFGVHFKYLEHLGTETLIDEKKNTVCIASTFTAEPIFDSLKFWSDYFDIDYNIQFAPYNQVFQQLLDPASLFSNNTDGINLILLGLEDWASTENALLPRVNDKELERLFNHRLRYTLPNKAEIVHLNKYETEYLYKEIFIDKCYLKHGIQLNDGDTIIDIGANIGLFTLFAIHSCYNPNIYAFEPSPSVYELLKINSEIYGENVKAFNYGISEKKKFAEFTFYPKSSVFSGFNPNEEEDKDAVKKVVGNILKNISSQDAESFEDYIEEITSGRLEKTTYECELISVSDIINDNKIEKIDLLKIDAEKSELNILKGIRDSDWPKIKQVVIEVHDKAGIELENIKCILNERGFEYSIEEEELLKESGLYNIYAKKPNQDKKTNSYNGIIDTTRSKLNENLQNFYTALDSFIKTSQTSMIIGICPRSSKVLSEPKINSVFNELENDLVTNISGIPNVSAITSLTFQNKYPIVEYYDPDGDQLGHIPFNPVFYTSLGTTLFRTMFSLQYKQYKVIVLDCDNTLWGGVCGEDGTDGIKISESFKALQKFMLEQLNSGMLICLCSKNNEEDVFEVFDKRNDMILKRDHLVSYRLNWDFKSENIKSLAEEINLGLDSFIFIDDNPVECADVKINCPEVLTLQLPKDEFMIPNFLKNIWVFDHLKLTEEDKKRTRMYKDNVQREKYQRDALTLKDFIDGLKLEIKITTPTLEQLSRVAQLTHRTNQFNFTTIRRNENEIKILLHEKNYNCLIAKVKDRFGDYGIVSVLLYTIDEDVIKIDTFLISCRVLGRGVEHKILSEIGIIAAEINLSYVEIPYIQTAKNRPALKFIDSIGAKYRKEISNGFLFKFPSEVIRKMIYEPTAVSQDLSKESKMQETKKEKPALKLNKGISDLTEKIQQIGDDFNDLHAIHERIEKHKIEDRSLDAIEYIEPKSDLEKQLSEIWQKILGKSIIGVNDNFFDLGGTSLKAVQLVATIKKDLKINLSIIALFECPTINLLTKKLNPNENSITVSVDHLDAENRGARRRDIRVIRRKLNE